MQLCDLVRNDLLRLSRPLYPPHPAEGVHIERKIVQLILIDGHRRIDVVVKLRESPHIVPDLSVRGVKNMGTVSVYLNAHTLLRVDISGNMVSSVNQQAALPSLVHLMCKARSKQPRSYNQIIIMHENLSLMFYFALYFLICTKSSIRPRILSLPS